MRKQRKKQNSTAAPESRENAPESRETVTALVDAPIEMAPQSVGDTSAAARDRERIAMRAYELYLARGGGEGSALDDWLAAEREFTSADADRDQE
jgi:hypothetical protein